MECLQNSPYLDKALRELEKVIQTNSPVQGTTTVPHGHDYHKNTTIPSLPSHLEYGDDLVSLCSTTEEADNVCKATAYGLSKYSLFAYREQQFFNTTKFQIYVKPNLDERV